MNTYKLAALFVSIVGLSAAGCSFKKDDGPTPEAAAAEEFIKTIEAKKQQQAFEGKLTKDNVTVRFDETDVIGFYEMVLTWPSAIATMMITIDDRTPEIRQQSDGGIFKMMASSGKEHKIELIAYDSLGSPVSTLSLVERVPIDLVVDKTFHLNKSENFEVNRIFFHDGAQIVTNGFDLYINAKKIFIVNEEFASSRVPAHLAHIITTLPNSLATDRGRLMGSKIQISADQAVGTLAVALIGYNGPDGQNGADASPPAPGALNGVNGQPGQQKSRWQPCRTSFNIDIPCEPEVVVCSVAATPGADGKPGLNGSPGADGWSGGSTGDLVVDIKNSSEFKLEVAQKVGLPGKGGFGGKGTPGGKGGLGGHKTPYCGAAGNGKDGPHGVKGADGKNGEPGKKSTVIHNVQKVEIYDL